MPAASIPDFVTLGPSLIFKPSVFKTVSPTVTLPAALTLVTLIVSFKLNVTLSSAAFLVILILPSVLFKSTVSPGATLLLFSPLAVKFQPLLATFSTSFNCEKFTASLSSVPASTLVILLPAASMPDLVTLGPPTIFKPSVLMVVSPAFTLSTLISLANLISNLSVPSATTPMLPSESLVSSVTPPTKLTFSPNLRSTSFPASPAKVNGMLRTLLIALVTSPAVARLLGFAAVALPSASVVIVVVLTSNFTIVPLSASVTFTVVKLPSLKFTKPLLLIRDLEVPFCCTLKPL